MYDVQCKYFMNIVHVPYYHNIIHSMDSLPGTPLQAHKVELKDVLWPQWSLDLDHLTLTEGSTRT
jgi:hypothetical protein